MPVPNPNTTGVGFNHYVSSVILFMKKLLKILAKSEHEQKINKTYDIK